MLRWLWVSRCSHGPARREDRRRRVDALGMGVDTGGYGDLDSGVGSSSTLGHVLEDAIDGGEFAVCERRRGLCIWGVCG